MALELGFEFDGIKYKMLSRDNNLGLSGPFGSYDRIFLRLIKDGRVKLFEYHFSGSAGAPMMSAGGGAPMTMGGTPGGCNSVLQKGDGPLFEISVSLFNSFKKQASDYFSDCPELSNKILNKEYHKDDIEQIVDYYNKLCK